MSFQEIDPDLSISTVKARKPETGAGLKTADLSLPVRIDSDKQIFSYTSLVHSQASPGEIQDYEQWAGQVNPNSNIPPEMTDDLSLFNFPKGALAGTVIHKLFEYPQLDFSRPRLPDSVVSGLLKNYGLDVKWGETLQTMITEVIHADLGELHLDEVPAGAHLKEMEFHFSTNRLTEERILSLIRSAGETGRPAESLTGYMTGFIDLIVKQNDRYYILDYKSNWLGHTFNDYKPDKLRTEILASKYDIQYHIYTLALVKYLRHRSECFDYDTHFGGIYYLFVRGMRSGSDNGIYFHKPDAELMNKLEASVKRHDRP